MSLMQMTSKLDMPAPLRLHSGNMLLISLCSFRAVVLDYLYNEHSKPKPILAILFFLSVRNIFKGKSNTTCKSSISQVLFQIHQEVHYTENYHSLKFQKKGRIQLLCFYCCPKITKGGFIALKYKEKVQQLKPNKLKDSIVLGKKKIPNISLLLIAVTISSFELGKDRDKRMEIIQGRKEAQRQSSVSTFIHVRSQKAITHLCEKLL